MTVAGLVAAAMLLVLIGFQLALAAGAPWGAAAWGGQNPGVLPRGLRIASAVVGLVVYPLLLAVIVATAGLIGDSWVPFDPRVLLWPLAAFFGLGVVVNAISRSRPERIWAVVSAVLTICCVVLALG